MHTVFHYLVLLRGINVGGKNIIKMVDLKKSFEDMGFRNVITYIQSGNVLFGSSERDSGKLTEKIERVLSKKFNYKSRVVVVSREVLKEIVQCAPKGFGKKLDQYRYDIIFFKPPMSPEDALPQVSVKPGVDQVFAGKHTLYFSRLIAKAAQSHLPRIIQKPVYQSMTIRNWNTTTKLLEMMCDREG